MALTVTHDNPTSARPFVERKDMPCLFVPMLMRMPRVYAAILAAQSGIQCGITVLNILIRPYPKLKSAKRSGNQPL